MKKGPTEASPTRLRAIAGGRSAKGRTLTLDVRAFEDTTEAIQASVKALRPSEGATRSVSVAAARELLTDQRVRLLRAIRKERPISVAALARIVGRPTEAVAADLTLLARAGIVILESPSAKSQVRVPRVAFDRVEIHLGL
jgi:predicted transcriptional regulator